MRASRPRRWVGLAAVALATAALLLVPFAAMSLTGEVDWGWGDFVAVAADERTLCFDRVHAGQRLRCTFNLSPTEVPLRRHNGALIETGPVLAAALRPYAALIEEI